MDEDVDVENYEAVLCSLNMARTRELGYIQSLRELERARNQQQKRIAELERDLSAYKTAEELWCRRDDQHQRLRDALEDLKAALLEVE